MTKFDFTTPAGSLSLLSCHTFLQCCPFSVTGLLLDFLLTSFVAVMKCYRSM